MRILSQLDRTVQRLAAMHREPYRGIQTPEDALGAGRIVVDATALDTGHRGRGIGRYVSGLLGGMAELGPALLTPAHQAGGPRADRLAVLRMSRLRDRSTPGGAVAEVPGQGVDSPYFETWHLNRPSVGHFVRWSINEALLPGELAGRGTRLYHGTEPWSIPHSARFATVMTVHDVIPLMYPEHYMDRVHWNWRLYYEWLGRRGRWRDLTHIIAISEATREALCTHLDVDPARISVVPNGIDHEQFQPVTDEAALTRTRKHHGLERPFVLYLGGYDWRKNIGHLVRAMHHVPADVELVLAGGMSTEQRAELEGVMRAVGVGHRVRFAGYVPDRELPALYSLAAAFAYPSLAEGFGLQALEAMACGCPVVVARATSLPEVVGNAGLVADAYDADDFGQALARVVSDDALAGELRARGLAQVQKYSWERCARETLAVYQHVLAL